MSDKEPKAQPCKWCGQYDFLRFGLCNNCDGARDSQAEAFEDAYGEYGGDGIDSIEDTLLYFFGDEADE